LARDRKRAKQRAQRRGAAKTSGVPGAPGTPGAAEGQQHASQLTRADLPAALGHMGDVDEFDAALVRGAGGVPMPEGSPLPGSEDLTGLPDGDGEQPDGSDEEAVSAGNGKGNGVTSAPVRAPARPDRSNLSLPKRASAFLRASWAELQRVQWPNRAQVTQATAVVLGFVAVAGIYFGVADYVAKEVVEAIL
jgi:preprotein translocase SecE subunit